MVNLSNVARALQILDDQHQDLSTNQILHTGNYMQINYLDQKEHFYEANLLKSVVP